MKKQYVLKRPQKKTLEIIQHVDKICTDYQNRGYRISLRQCFYVGVSTGLWENSVQMYKTLGNCVRDGRLMGLLDWDAFEDRNRSLYGFKHHESVSEIVRGAAYLYRVDKWAEQPCYVEVWVEKDALRQVVGKACGPLDVDYFPCKGYSSVTELHSAALRFQRRADRECHIIYLGDHDPSGLDMTRNVTAAMALYGASVQVDRVALNFDQVQEFNPPPNSAKETDSRYKKYCAKYGESCWELDALKPEILESVIQDAIRGLMDAGLFDKACQREKDGQAEIVKLAANYDNVTRFLREIGA